MATVTATLDVARAEIGTIGGAKYRTGTAPWCASFVSWVLRTAGVNPRFDSASTGSFVTWAQQQGRWKTSGPRPGDLVLFRWPGAIRTTSNPPVNHIGIVEAVNANGSLTTIEGNTSTGSNANGNGVARRSRATTYVQGYVSLDYDTTPDTPDTPTIDPQEDDMPIFMRITTGGIYAIQAGRKHPLTAQEWALWVRLGAELRGGDFNEAEVDIVTATTA